MGLVSSTKEAVFFVSGTGVAIAGGVTKAKWDAAPVVSNYVGVDGATIATAANCAVANNGGNVQLQKGGAAFASVIAGTIAYVDFSSDYTDGHYEILSVDNSGDNITIDLVYTTNFPLAEASCGGAFTDIDTADGFVSAASYSMWIYSNKAQTLAAAINLNGGGTVAKNTRKYFVGFNTTPGDMDYGGVYYQSPLDAYINGIDTNKCVGIDANGGAFQAWIVDVPSVTIRNFIIRNTNKASNNTCIGLTTAAVGLELCNCRLYDAYRAISDTCNYILLRNCLVGDGADNFRLQIGGVGIIAYGNVFNIGTGDKGLFVNIEANSLCSVSVFDNLFIGGTSAGLQMHGMSLLLNNTFYNQTTQCFYGNLATTHLVALSNIFNPAAGATDIIITFDTNGGSVLLNDYNCNYGADNVAIATFAASALAGSTLATAGVHSINKNPVFLGVSRNDFRLDKNSPCLNKGLTLLNGQTTIGAWQPHAITEVDRRGRYQYEDIYSVAKV